MLGEEQANSVNGMDTQLAFKDQATTPLHAELKKTNQSAWCRFLACIGLDLLKTN